MTEASAITSMRALELRASMPGIAAMWRKSSARCSRWMSGTWSALVAANSALSMCGPHSNFEKMLPEP